MTIDDVTYENEITFTDDLQFKLSVLTPAKSRAILLWITGRYNFKEIGEIVGVNGRTISDWLGDPVSQEIITELQTREFYLIDNSLKALRIKAVAALNELLDSPKEEVKLSAVKDVLDRTGHKAINEVKIDKKVSIEKQLKDLAEFTITERDIIDITDAIEEIKNE